MKCTNTMGGLHQVGLINLRRMAEFDVPHRLAIADMPPEKIKKFRENPRPKGRSLSLISRLR